MPLRLSTIKMKFENLFLTINETIKVCDIHSGGDFLAFFECLYDFLSVRLANSWLYTSMSILAWVFFTPCLDFGVTQWVAFYACVGLSRFAWPTSFVKHCFRAVLVMHLVSWLVPPHWSVMVLFTFITTCQIFAICLRSLTVQRIENVNPNTQVRETKTHLAVNSWFAAKFLQWFASFHTIGKERVYLPPNPMDQLNDWMDRLDRLGGQNERRRRGLGFVGERVLPLREHTDDSDVDDGSSVVNSDSDSNSAVPCRNSVANSDNSDSNPVTPQCASCIPQNSLTTVPDPISQNTFHMTQILDGMSQLVKRLDSLDLKVSAIDISTEVHQPPPSYVDTLAVTSDLSGSKFYTGSLLFLAEEPPLTCLNEAGVLMFNSKAATSVARVVSENNGNYDNWATCFKVGADKICTVAHANSDPNAVQLGKPMVDNDGKPLLVELILKDDKVVRFPLIPYYRSSDHHKDMVLCSMPLTMHSLVPGLKVRGYDSSTDSEIAIMGYPAHSKEISFSTSRVKDRSHTAGTTIGTSGAPILVQGRVAIGVHEGVTVGEQVKRYHSFSPADIEAMMEPAPPLPVKMVYGEYAGQKKKDRRRREAQWPEGQWADSTGDDMDYNTPPFGDTDRALAELLGYQAKKVPKGFQEVSPPTSPRMRKEDIDLVAQRCAEFMRQSHASAPLQEASKKKKVKSKKPICPNLSNAGICHIGDPNHLGQYDHKLKGKDFPSGSTQVEPVGQPSSVRSTV